MGLINANSDWLRIIGDILSGVVLIMVNRWARAQKNAAEARAAEFSHIDRKLGEVRDSVGELRSDRLLRLQWEEDHDRRDNERFAQREREDERLARNMHDIRDEVTALRVQIAGLDHRRRGNDNEP